MLFNSLSFLLFFVIVTALYFALPHRFRWLLLLVASCVFYMCFIPAYILILFTTIIIDYFAAIWIEETQDARKRKKFLLISVVSVCAVLFVFKYFNFFSANAALLARALHWNYPIQALKIVLPIGLSFHTFQSLSYVIEVYRSRQRAERHIGRYALYVMYFPQLVAGPIERPQNLLHQFYEEKRWDWQRLRDGLSLALWGLFKKVVVADTLAIYTDTVYKASSQHNGSSLLLATYFFAFQVYCDFSGYSDIARGVSWVYGIRLMKNFETPFFSKSIGEFWSRWHISLSTWFRDYLYIPLGGNRVSVARSFFNIMVVFLVSGLWHGANWTFIVFGALQGTYLVAERAATLVRKRWLPVSASWNRSRFVSAAKILLTFHLILLSLVVFRADSVETACGILRKILFVHGPVFWDPLILTGACAIAMLLVCEIFNRRTDYWDSLEHFPRAFRLAYSMVLLFGVVLFGIDGGSQFIYFQF
jgi:alginate O-acetyltransferase complex protein AlgI